MNTFFPLDLLEAGEWAEVHKVCGDQAWVHRLAEMGLHGGSRLRMLQSGSPCLVQVGGMRLSLRSDGPAEITVRPLGNMEPLG